MIKEKCCGTCKYHKYDWIDDGLVCVNPKSEHCTDLTECDDYCEDWEEREK